MEDIKLKTEEKRLEMKSGINVLISNSFDHIEDENLMILCHELGYDDWTDYDARVDEIIINWVRYNLNKVSNNTYSDDKGNRIRIETVDTTRRWQIQDYNGIEHINYIKVYNEKLNWVY